MVVVVVVVVFVVVFQVVFVVVVVVAIVCPVSWQVRGAALPIKPKPASQPSNKLQVLFTFEACRRHVGVREGDNNNNKEEDGLPSYLVARHVSTFNDDGAAATFITRDPSRRSCNPANFARRGTDGCGGTFTGYAGGVIHRQVSRI